MTVQQQVSGRVFQMSDEGASFLEQVIESMSSRFFLKMSTDAVMTDSSTSDVSRRIGIARGRIGNTDNFDRHNDEIALLFEG